MTFPPAVKVPQSMELRGVVQALFEYTPKFADVDTEPVVPTVWVEDMAAKVVRVKRHAIVTNDITAAVTETFTFGMFNP